ncbi:hypothetical protein HK099_001871 [Clydaea vesicula]|uniref:Prolyl endopeptidase-like n=1 Tax=Clydaea vesicula TaxID=447962 RepID=A0AAD5U345_9FUNG|nr:hypothetical protein HK099_001871 [Clydaea vesicula]
MKNLLLDGKHLLISSVPVMAGFMLETLFEVSTTAMVATIGEDELTQVGLAFMFCNLTGYSVGLGLNTAMDTLASQAFTRYEMTSNYLNSSKPTAHQIVKGEDGKLEIESKNTELYTILQRSILISITSTIPMAFFWFNSRYLLQFSGQNEKNIAKTVTFIRFMIPSLPGFLIFDSLKKFSEAQGKLSVAPLTLLISIMIHMVLTWYLINIVGVLGAAISISLSYTLLPLIFVLTQFQSISTITVSTIKIDLKSFNSKKRGNLAKHLLDSVAFKIVVLKHLMSLNLRRFFEWWSKDSFLDWGPYLELGIPGAIIMASEWGSFEVCRWVSGLSSQNALNLFTKLHMFAHICYIAPYSFGVVTTNHVGNLLGKGNVMECKNFAQNSIFITSVVGAFISILILVGAVWLEISFTLALLIASFQLLDGIQNVAGSILRASGYHKVVAKSYILSYYVCGLPLGIFLTFEKGISIWAGLVGAVFLLALLQCNVIFSTDWKDVLKMNVEMNATLTKKKILVLSLIPLLICGYHYSYNNSLIYNIFCTTTSSHKSLTKQVHDKFEAPMATEIPYTTQIFEKVLTDNFQWMKDADREDSSFLNYIKQENDYTENMMAGTRALREKLESELNFAPANVNKLLYKKFCGNLELEKFDLYWEEGPYFYWRVYENNNKYPSYFRRKLAVDKYINTCDCLVKNFLGEPELLLDFNRAFNSIEISYFAIGVFKTNPIDMNLLAFNVDFNGSENHFLFILNLNTSDIFFTGEFNSYYSLQWGIDHSTGSPQHWLFYTVVDRESGTPRIVKKICIRECDVTLHLFPLAEFIEKKKKKEKLKLHNYADIVYFEKDLSLTVELDRTANGIYILLKIVGQITSEVMILESTNCKSHDFEIIFQRQIGIFYEIEHHEKNLFFARINNNFKNFKIIQFEVLKKAASEKILNVVPVFQNLQYFVEKFVMFKNYLVLFIWENGLQKIVILNLTKIYSENSHTHNSMSFSKYKFDVLKFHEKDNSQTEVYSIFNGFQTDLDTKPLTNFNSKCLVFSNSSYIQRISYFSYDMQFKKMYSHSQQSMDFSNLYKQERILVNFLENSTDKDRGDIPLTFVYKKKENELEIKPKKLLLYVYGAYGGFKPPIFDSSIFPLLDRGMTYAVCHPRGDADLGYKWYEGGKLENKINSILDTGACLKGLIERGYTKKGWIALHARSAGGLIAGGMINWFSFTGDVLYNFVKVVFTQVPFVDVINDMIDPKVSWTPFEYYEWGNPLNNSILFNKILNYSPYQNIEKDFLGNEVKSKKFPSILVFGGLHDPRVQVWEPVKYVAKLRKFKLNNPDAIVGKNSIGSPLLLKISEKGHFAGGNEENAFWYSFVLIELGIYD